MALLSTGQNQSAHRFARRPRARGSILIAGAGLGTRHGEFRFKWLHGQGLAFLPLIFHVGQFVP
jgi:hypothetical protein